MSLISKNIKKSKDDSVREQYEGFVNDTMTQIEDINKQLAGVEVSAYSAIRSDRAFLKKKVKQEEITTFFYKTFQLFGN